MLLNYLSFSHGVITNPQIRQSIFPETYPVGEVFKGSSTANLNIKTGQIKTTAEMMSNLASVGSVYSDSAPCRYNNIWNATNFLSAGPNIISWNVSIVHTNSTCIFNLYKNEVHITTLSDPFQCALSASMESHTIFLPECTLADKCTIQWYWSADLPIAQFINCIDYSTASNISYTSNNLEIALVLLAVALLVLASSVIIYLFYRCMKKKRTNQRSDSRSEIEPKWQLEEPKLNYLELRQSKLIFQEDWKFNPPMGYKSGSTEAETLKSYQKSDGSQLSGQRNTMDLHFVSGPPKQVYQQQYATTSERLKLSYNDMMYDDMRATKFNSK